MREQTRRALVVAFVAATVFVMGGAAASAHGAVHQTSEVKEFATMDSVGEARLTRTTSGVSFKLATGISGELVDFGGPLGLDWVSGDATTVWFVVFNDPDECTDDSCGEDDVLAVILSGFNPAGIGVHYGAGHVAGGERFRAAATLREGDGTGHLFGELLHDAMTAEVHLIVRSHGPAAALTGQKLSAALHTVDGGCGGNTCGDPQFAVFLSP